MLVLVHHAEDVFYRITRTSQFSKTFYRSGDDEYMELFLLLVLAHSMRVSFNANDARVRVQRTINRNAYILWPKVYVQ